MNRNYARAEHCSKFRIYKNASVPMLSTLRLLGHVNKFESKSNSLGMPVCKGDLILKNANLLFSFRGNISYSELKCNVLN